MMYELEKGQSSSRTRELCCVLLLGVVVFAVGIAGGYLLAVYAHNGGPTGNNFKIECVMPSSSGSDENKQTTAAPVQTTTAKAADADCPTKKRDPFVQPHGQEIFAPLTNAEMQMVRQYLIQKGIVSDATGGDVKFTSNYITSIDVHTPLKKDVLEHRYHGGKFPGRHAVAAVARGAAVPPDIMEYVVGPLENPSQLSASAITVPGENAFNVRALDDWEFMAIMAFLGPTHTILNPLVRDSFDGVSFGDPDFGWFPYNGPPGATQDLREWRLSAMFKGAVPAASFIEFLPLEFHLNTTSQNTAEWRAYDFHYLNQGPYATAQELVDNYFNGNIRKVKLFKGYRQTVEQRLSPGRDVSKPLRSMANHAAPRTYEPEGPRYTIQGHQISWMGWKFDVTTRMMRGPALFDITFQNERIVYELSMNDIVLQYGSDSFGRSNVFYSDSVYGIGYYNGLIKGVDCPEHGTTLDASFYAPYDAVAVATKAICVFESDGEGPLYRHSKPAYTAGLRDTFLVVRVAVAIGNYDYVTEFHFTLDGRLETKVSATGYPQTGFWDPGNPNRGNENTDDSHKTRDPFGYRITDYGNGLVHDHMFGFKVDMDVIDTNNSFEVIHLKFGSVVDAFRKMNPTVTQKPDYFLFNTTRYVEYETIQQEGGYKINPYEPKIWMIVNENYRNAWGSKRGYAIVPGCTAVQNLQAPHPTLAAASFSEYTCAVTRQKDAELFINSVYDGFRLDNPRGHISRMMDGESVVNTDLVTWVTVGFLHMPSSEDMPMTTGAHTGFTLKPFNFFDRTETFDMPQNYKGNYGINEKPATFESTCFKPAQNP